MARFRRSSGEIRWSRLTLDFAEIDLNPVHFAAEFLVRRIIVGNWRAEVISYVTGLVGGEDHWLCMVYSAFARLLPVHIERNRSALRQTTSVIRKLHAYLVCTRWDRYSALNRVPVHAIEVVAVLRLSILCVETPAADDSA